MSSAPIVLAFLFAVVVFARDLSALVLLGPGYNQDAASFVIFGRMLGDLDVQMPLYLRPPPHIIINLLTGSYFSLYPLLLFHFAVAALAVGFLVYAAALSSPLAGGLIGLALLLDLVWNTYQVIPLLEGPLLSFQLLALAALAYHAHHRPAIGSAGAFAVALLAAWALIMRPSNVPLLLLIPLLYLLWTRSWRPTLAAAVGVAAMAAALIALNAWRTGDARLWAQSGWYAQFPLFHLEMFDAANGPRSQRMAEHLARCRPDLSPQDIRMVGPAASYSQYAFEQCMREGEHAFLLANPQAAPAGILDARRPAAECSALDDAYAHTVCAYGGTNWRFEEHVADFINDTYMKEALPANISRVPGLLLEGSADYLTVATYLLAGQYWLTPYPMPNPATCPFEWCTKEVFSGPAQLTIEDQAKALSTVKWTLQTYLPLTRELYGWRATPLQILFSWLTLSAAIVLFTRGAVRFVALATCAFILYSAATITLFNVLIPRYTAGVSGFHAVHSALIGFVLLSLLLRAGQSARRLLDARYRAARPGPKAT